MILLRTHTPDTLPNAMHTRPLASAPAPAQAARAPAIGFTRAGALLVAASLILPRFAPDPAQALTLYTIRVTILLLIPALAIFPWLRREPAWWPYWRLFWTWSYIAYLTHFFWTVLGVFGGDIPRIFDDPRVSSPAFNFVLTSWWGLDVLLAWRATHPAGWIRAQRAALQAVTFLAFVVAAGVQAQGITRMLEIVLVAVVGASAVASVVGARRGVGARLEPEENEGN